MKWNPTWKQQKFTSLMHIHTKVNGKREDIRKHGDLMLIGSQLQMEAIFYLHLVFETWRQNLHLGSPCQFCFMLLFPSMIQRSVLRVMIKWNLNQKKMKELGAKGNFIFDFSTYCFPLQVTNTTMSYSASSIALQFSYLILMWRKQRLILDSTTDPWMCSYSSPFH